MLYLLFLGAKDATEAKIAPCVMLHCGINGPNSGAWKNANVMAGASWEEGKGWKGQLFMHFQRRRMLGAQAPNA